MTESHVIIMQVKKRLVHCIHSALRMGSMGLRTELIGRLRISS